MYSKILVPLDGSNFSEPAGAIIDLARKTSNSLIAMPLTAGREPAAGYWAASRKELSSIPKTRYYSFERLERRSLFSLPSYYY